MRTRVCVCTVCVRDRGREREFVFRKEFGGEAREVCSEELSAGDEWRSDTGQEVDRAAGRLGGYEPECGGTAEAVSGRSRRTGPEEAASLKVRSPAGGAPCLG